MTAAQKRAFETLWPRFGIDLGAQALDLDRVFGRRAARVLEVGFGDGEALVEQAGASPGTDFLGVEVHAPGIGHCLLEAAARDLGNLKIVRHDVVEVLDRGIARASLDRINIWFPDPWPKKRHRKRRLLNAGFTKLAAARLKEGGTLHIATDWADYAAQIDEVTAGCDGLRLAERREHAGERPLERPPTKFERRGVRLGHRIAEWRLVRMPQTV